MCVCCYTVHGQLCMKEALWSAYTISTTQLEMYGRYSYAKFFCIPETPDKSSTENSPLQLRHAVISRKLITTFCLKSLRGAAQLSLCHFTSMASLSHRKVELHAAPDSKHMYFHHWFGCCLSCFSFCLMLFSQHFSQEVKGIRSKFQILSFTQMNIQ